MTPDRLFRGLNGIEVMITAALTFWVSPWFILLTAFIGFMLIQSSLTNVCPGLWISRKILEIVQKKSV